MLVKEIIQELRKLDPNMQIKFVYSDVDKFDSFDDCEMSLDDVNRETNIVYLGLQARGGRGNYFQCKYKNKEKGTCLKEFPGDKFCISHDCNIYDKCDYCIWKGEADNSICRHCRVKE